MDSLKRQINDSIKTKQALLENLQLLEQICAVTEIVSDALKRGNKIMFAGNGGSAADAQHLAAEFVSKLEFDRPGLPSISLSTDTSILTAIGNDYGYDQLFKRQIQAQAKPGDVFFGITTSGRSINVLAAFEACTQHGITSVALCGQGGQLEGKVDYLLRVPSNHTPRIQECHILIGHAICAEVELRMFQHLKTK